MARKKLPLALDRCCFNVLEFDNSQLASKSFFGGGEVAKSYGELVPKARGHHDPPLSAKELANALGVSLPFITDIKKSRRLPSMEWDVLKSQWERQYRAAQKYFEAYGKLEVPVLCERG